MEKGYCFTCRDPEIKKEVRVDPLVAKKPFVVKWGTRPFVPEINNFKNEFESVYPLREKIPSFEEIVALNLITGRYQVSLEINQARVNPKRSQMREKWDPKLDEIRPEMEIVAENFIQKLLDEGWISEISHEQAKLITPSKWIAKKDDKEMIMKDKIRLTTTFCYLNDCSRKRNVNYPKEDEIKEMLRGAKFAMKGDVANGYWQVEIKEDQRPYTAFYALGRLFVYNRVPQGHTNACFLFHEIVRKELQGVPNCMNYIDDILCWGDTKEEVEINFAEARARLLKIGMALEDAKSSMEASREIDFLRWTWELTGNEARCHVNKEKKAKLWKFIESMIDAGTFIEAGRLASLFGKVSYLLRGRQGIKELQDIKRSIGNIKKDCAIKMKNPVNQALLLKIKERLAGETLVRMNDPAQRSTWMWTDASEWGIGILIKLADKRRTWYYWNFKREVPFTKIIENEAKAAVVGLRILALLKRRNAEINTDNPTTMKVLQGKDPNVKKVNVDELRAEVSTTGITWLPRLQNKSNEDFEMGIADLLSRNQKEKALAMLEERESIWKSLGEENGEKRSFRILRFERDWRELLNEGIWANSKLGDESQTLEKKNSTSEISRRTPQ